MLAAAFVWHLDQPALLDSWFKVIMVPTFIVTFTTMTHLSSADSHPCLLKLTFEEMHMCSLLVAHGAFRTSDGYSGVRASHSLWLGWVRRDQEHKLGPFVVSPSASLML